MQTAPGPLLRTLSATWKHLQEQHPDLPPTQFVITTTPPTTFHGAERWPWDPDEGTNIPISVDTLKAGHVETLEFLFHEAAHLLCWRRGIKDTAMRGRYHNTRYLAAAKEIGMEWPDGHPRVEGLGYPTPRLTTAIRNTYETELGELGDALTRVLPHLALPEHSKPQRPSRVAMHCKCPKPRVIRTYPGTADLGPITCGICNAPFAAV
ncbi:hypothetical protein [Streptomyces cinereoruber]|uniref:hypothetical protein n=1 Tax=Streptomyces cinereoruber TaxID=67260 RepID=UPI00363423D8